MRAAKEVLALALLSAVCVLARAADESPRADPDRWYHYAVSRAWAEHGLPRTLSGPEDIGWNRAFPEKEFLFHVLTAGGYALGGPRGVDAVSLVLELGVVAAAYLLARQRAAPGLAFALVLLLVPATGAFLFRLELVRALSLAVLCFTLLVAALLAQSRAGAAAASLGYALAYHTWYMPGLVLGIALLSGLLGPRAERWRACRVASWGLLGLAAGVVLNPYFPLTVQIGLEHLAVAFAPSASGGGELERWPLGLFLTTFGLLLMCFLLGAAVLQVRARSVHEPVELLGVRRAMVLGGAVCWVLTAIQPRAAEYAVPMTLAVAALAFGPAPVRWLQVAVGLVAVPGLASSLRPGPVDAVHRYLLGLPAALASLSALPDGAKVLNTSFDEGTVLAWAFPRLRFVDLLEPKLLARREPELSHLRQQLREGELLDPAAAMDRFGAQAIVSGYPRLVAQLERDPFFVRLEPPPGHDRPLGDGPYVYAFRRFEPAVREWTVRAWHPANAQQQQGAPPAAPGEEVSSATDVLELSTRPARAEAPVTCFTLQPRTQPDEGWLFVAAQPWWQLWSGAERVPEGHWVHREAGGAAVSVVVCAPKNKARVAARAVWWPSSALRERCALEGQPGTEDCFARRK